jgi:seryl-tRNA synthetase
MTSIAYILDNYDKYEQVLEQRFMNKTVLSTIKNLHTEYVDAMFTCDKYRKLQNRLGTSIKNAKSNKTNTETRFVESPLLLLDEDLIDYSKECLIFYGSTIKKTLTDLENSVKKLLKERDVLVSKLPNLLNSQVPIFNSEDNNEIIKISGSLEKKPLHQYQLCMKLQILESASLIAGHRGYFLVGLGARLNYALISYAIDFITNRDYKIMMTPHFMNTRNIKEVCQLSEFQDTLYELKDEDKFLIATSEQCLTAYFKNMELNKLPVKLGGISTCYRKEAGRHSEDTLGIFRCHQFEKVEQFCVTNKDSSFEMFQEMIQTSAEFYESLGLSYRIISIVSGALNNAASIKYDLEGWFSGSGKFRELVSCSDTTDYFSRRLNVKDSENNYVHMLNSTLCANTRTICAIFEQWQTDSGVQIPPVLIKYMNGIDFIPFKE